MPSPSCGRSSLKSLRQRSKRCCCAKPFTLGGRQHSAFIVGCIRSWQPLSCGQAGRENSTSMPSLGPPHAKPALPRLLQPLDFEDETAVQIRHRERIAAPAVAREKPALEVSTPSTWLGRFGEVSMPGSTLKTAPLRRRSATSPCRSSTSPTVLTAGEIRVRGWSSGSAGSSWAPKSNGAASRCRSGVRPRGRCGR